MADINALIEANKRGLLTGDRKKAFDESVNRGLIPDIKAQQPEFDEAGLKDVYRQGFQPGEDDLARSYNTLYLNHQLDRPLESGDYEGAAKSYLGGDTAPPPLAMAEQIKRMIDVSEQPDEMETFLKEPLDIQNKTIFDYYKDELPGTEPGLDEGISQTINSEDPADPWAKTWPGTKEKYRKKYFNELLDRSPKMRAAVIDKNLGEKAKRWAQRTYLTRTIDIQEFLGFPKQDQQLALDLIDLSNQELDYKTGQGLARLKNYENYEVALRVSRVFKTSMAAHDATIQNIFGPLDSGENLLATLQKHFGPDLMYQGQPLFTTPGETEDGITAPGWTDMAAAEAAQEALERDLAGKEIGILTKHYTGKEIDFAQGREDWDPNRISDWVKNDLPEATQMARDEFEMTKATRRVQGLVAPRTKEDWTPRGIVLSNLEVGLEMGVIMAAGAVGGPAAAGGYTASRFYGEQSDKLRYEHKVPRHQADMIAAVATLPYVLVEYSQVNKLKAMPKKFVLGFSKNATRFVMMQFKKRGINYAQEVGEEAVQAMIEAAAMAYAKEFAAGQNIEYADLWNQVQDETVGAIKSMMLLQAPGAAIDVKRVYTAQSGANKMIAGSPMKLDRINKTLEAAKNLDVDIPIDNMQTDPEEVTPELKTQWRLAEGHEAKKQILIEAGHTKNLARLTAIIDRDILIEDMAAELAQEESPKPAIMTEVEDEMGEDGLDPESDTLKSALETLETEPVAAKDLDYGDYIFMDGTWSKVIQINENDGRVSLDNGEILEVDPETVLEVAGGKPLAQLLKSQQEQYDARTQNVPPDAQQQTDAPDAQQQTDPDAIPFDFPKQTTTDTPRYTIDEVQTEVDRLGYGPSVTVVQSLTDLPPALAGTAAKVGEQRAYIPGENEGITDVGNQHGYVIVDNLTEGRLDKVIIHEAVGHVGLRKALGEEKYSALLQDLMSDQDIMTEVRRIAAERNIDLSTDILEAGDEFFASQAEKNDFDPNILQKIYAKFREWFRKMGIVKRWTDNDIRNLLFQSSEAAKMKGSTPDAELERAASDTGDPALQEQFKSDSTENQAVRSSYSPALANYAENVTGSSEQSKQINAGIAVWGALNAEIKRIIKAEQYIGYGRPNANNFQAKLMEDPALFKKFIEAQDALSVIMGYPVTVIDTGKAFYKNEWWDITDLDSTTGTYTMKNTAGETTTAGDADLFVGKLQISAIQERSNVRTQDDVKSDRATLQKKINAYQDYKANYPDLKTKYAEDLKQFKADAKLFKKDPDEYYQQQAEKFPDKEEHEPPVEPAKPAKPAKPTNRVKPYRTNQMKPQFGGFGVTLSQIFLENLPKAKFERWRQELVQAQLHAYHHNIVNPDKPVLYMDSDGSQSEASLKTLLNLTPQQTGQQDPGSAIPGVLKSAEKTLAALNLSSACIMFQVGGNGCYFDGCYVTGMGMGGTTINFYQAGAYLGEILALSDYEIDELNAVGGLRINGMGDTTIEHLDQWRDIMTHASMRGLKMKVITKQDAVFDIIAALQDEGIVADIMIQPTIDPYWTPVEEDNIPGSGAARLGIARQITDEEIRADFEKLYEKHQPPRQVTDAEIADRKAVLQAEQLRLYKEEYGRDAKIIDGKVYRKWGYSWDQFGQLKTKHKDRDWKWEAPLDGDHSGIIIRPRVVVGSPMEIAEYALNHPDAIQTWMHAAIRPGLYSDVDQKVFLEDGGIGNYTKRIAIIKKDGEWRILAQGKKGTNEKVEAAAYTRLETYIKENYTEAQANQIFETLTGQLKDTPSALCCGAGADPDACRDCTSGCHDHHAFKDATGMTEPLKAEPSPNGGVRLSMRPKPLPATINIDGKDRSTTNSEGRQIADSEEKIRNFYKWFGDSKVVDDQGRPLVVYHGTATGGFTIFDTRQQGKNGGMARGGFSFTTDYLAADSYAVAHGDEVVALDEGLQIANNILSDFGDNADLREYFADQGHETDEGLPEFYWGAIDDQAGFADDLETYAKDTASISKEFSDAMHQAAVTIRAEASANPEVKEVYLNVPKNAPEYSATAKTLGKVISGLDVRELDSKAAMVTLDDGNKIFYVAESTQAKSATDNNGEFDGNNPNIRMSVAPTINIDGKDRPTTNSEGRQIADSEVKIRNFYKWFRDSKVVDDQGRPLVVYHGGKANINDFDKDDGTYYGSYFTSDPFVADDYAATRDSDGEVYDVYLSLNNPADIEYDKRVFEIIKKTESIAENDINEYTDNGGEIWQLITAQSFNALKKNGYDSITFGEEFAQTYTAFDPAQIKSATDNNGEFDGNNPNIRFSQSTRQPRKAQDIIAEKAQNYKQQLRQEMDNPADNAAAVLAFQIAKGKTISPNDARMFLAKYNLESSAEYVLELANQLAKGIKSDMDILQDNYLIKKAIRKARLGKYYKKIVMEFYKSAAARGEYLGKAKNVLNDRQKNVLSRRQGLDVLTLRDTHGVDAIAFTIEDITPESINTLIGQIREAVRQALVTEGVFTDRKQQVDSSPEYRREIQMTYFNVLNMAIARMQYGPRKTTLTKKLGQLMDRVTTSGIENMARDIMAGVEIQKVKESKEDLIHQIEKILNKRQIYKPSNKQLVGWKEGNISFDKTTWLHYANKVRNMSGPKVDEEVEFLMKAAANPTMTVGRNYLEKSLEVADKLAIIQLFGNMKAPDKTPADLKQVLELLMQKINEGEAEHTELYKRITSRAKERSRTIRTAVGEGKYSAAAGNDKTNLAKAASYIRNHMAALQWFRDLTSYADGTVQTEADATLMEMYNEMARAYLRERVTVQQHAETFHKFLDGLYETDTLAEQIKGTHDPDSIIRNLARSRPEYAKHSNDGKTPLSKDQLYQLWLTGKQSAYMTNVDPGRVRAIEQEFDAKDRAILTWLKKWYKDNRADLNEVSIRLTARPIEEPDVNYAPAAFLIEREGLDAYIKVFSPVPPFLTPRVNHNRPPNDDIGAIELWANRMQQTARYVHTAEIGIEYMLVFGDMDVKDTIKKRFGQKYQSEFLEMITDVVNGGPPAINNKYKTLDSLRSLFTLSKLAGSPASAIRQATSVPAFIFEIPAAEFTTHMASAFTPDGLAAMKDIWESDLRRERMGAFSQDVMDAVAHGFTKPSQLNKILTKLMIVPAAGDVVPTLLIGQGIYRSRIDHYISDNKTVGEAKKLAMEDVFIIANLTQQSSLFLNQPQFRRRGGSIGKFQGLFQGAVGQMLMQEISAARNMGRNWKSGKNWKRFITVMALNHFVLPGLYHLGGMVANALFGEAPDDDDWDRMWLNMALGPSSAFIIFGSLIAGGVETAKTGKRTFGKTLSPAADLYHTSDDFILLARHFFTAEWGELITDFNKILIDLMPPYRYGRKAYKNYIDK